MEGREWSYGQSHEAEERERESGTGEWAQRSLADEGGLNLDICAGVPQFLVTPLLMAPVCLHSLGWFEEPVRPQILKTLIGRLKD